MTYRAFRYIRVWGVVGVLVWLVVDAVSNAASGDIVAVRAYHGLKNWDEHLYGHWHWWERLYDAFNLFSVGVFGWVVGQLWRVRKYSDLPGWAKWCADKVGVDKDFNLADEELDLPSRKQVILTGLPVVALCIWVFVS